MATATPNRPAVLLTLPERAWLAVNVAGLQGDAAATLVAISERESRGWSNAYRPASRNPGGGNDRGVLQWNDKAWPDISDAVAYDPVAAFAKAGEVIRSKERGGLEGFGPWDIGPNAYSGSPKSLDLTAARAAVARPVDPTPRLRGAGLAASPVGFNLPGPVDDWISGGAGKVVDVVGAPVGDIVDAILAVFGPVGDAFVSVARLLANLLDPTWWKRLGVGALGLGLIYAVWILANRDTIKAAAQTAVAAKTGGK